ncbi:hypothetical protein P7K49_003954 [Saguinus oedipus]|uniref:Uncharacterized protein n=1 Tax=Saguinus oedipus TaxID=9490 RepID=A0ABQ9W8C6_SAGOE|nr:hypothetical protein P7K49_003954 [Saguinus oedipus]
MARCQLQPKLEERSPQPSISGYSLLEVKDDEVPGPSDTGTPSKFLYWNMKREWSDQSEEEPKEETGKEPEETWVVDTLCGLKMKLKRERVSPVLPEDYKAFNMLLDSSLPNFLSWQKKRDWSGKSEEELKEETEKERAPEPEETWVLDSLCGLKMKLKRRRVSPVLPESYEAFNMLLAQVDDSIFSELFSTPDSSPALRIQNAILLGPSRKRDWSGKSEEELKEETEKERAPEPEETWVLDSLCGLKMKLKRRRVSPVLPESYEAFYTLPDSSLPNFLSWQKKRDWSGKSEEELKEETEKERAPEPEETWVLDSLCGLKMKLKRRRVSPVLPESYEAFNMLPDRWKNGEDEERHMEFSKGQAKSPSSPWILCRKRKREWSDESEEDPKEETEKERTPEPEETWVLETLQGLKMKIKRRRVSPVLPEHHQAFNRLLEDPVVKRFLAWDTYLRASDKTLLTPANLDTPPAKVPWELTILGVSPTSLPPASQICIRPSNTPPPHYFPMSTVIPMLRSLL